MAKNLSRFVQSVILALAVLSNFVYAPYVEAQGYYWISTREDVFVRPEYEGYGSSIALLRYGDIVRVSRCIPDCDTPRGWAILEPFGATPVANISELSNRTREAYFVAGSPDNFIWAKITSYRGITVRDNNTIQHFGRGDELFFIEQTPDTLIRADGSVIPRTALDVFEPSGYSGWVNPPREFVFIIRDTTRVNERNEIIPALRYERFEAIRYNAREPRVIIVGGSITERSAVRYGFAHARPAGVPQNAQWVHVDLEQQVLTAYNGNNQLVFATLVSTGSARHPTRTGIFPVRRKITYTQMRGGGTHPYSVEGVPWVMYFDDAIALHGAFWHDQFGTRRSHGCVNLSITDAKWLWHWTNMVVPNGWRSVHPIVAYRPEENLWVVVE